MNLKNKNIHDKTIKTIKIHIKQLNDQNTGRINTDKYG